MRIPKVISLNNREYIFVKQYPHFILYKDIITGCKTTVNPYDLGIVEYEQVEKPRLRSDMNPKL